MESTRETIPAIKPVRAILRGGPESIPDESRVQIVSPRVEKIKMPHFGGYEHFERTTAVDASGVPVEVIFRWTMRTEMAE
jgi:Family of unknown function (DUF5988)